MRSLGGSATPWVAPLLPPALIYTATGSGALALAALLPFVFVGAFLLGVGRTS